MTDFFPKSPGLNPRIYAYSDANLEKLLKVGFTTRNVKTRIKEQYPTARPGNAPYKIVLDESAMRADGTAITDHEIHRYLRKEEATHRRRERVQDPEKTNSGKTHKIRHPSPSFYVFDRLSRAHT